NLNSTVASNQLASGQAKVGRFQCAAQIINRQAQSAQALWFDIYPHYTPWTTNGFNLAGTRYTLELDLDTVGNALQVISAKIWVLVIHGQRHNRHIINTHRAGNRGQHAQITRQPV